MFDIGFSEIVVCAIVALLVIGPERMPEAVRTAGLWIGRLKRSLHETRSEIERQIGVDDIRRQLHNEDIMRNIETARRNMEDVIAKSQSSFNTIEHEYQSEADLPYHAHTEAELALTASSEIADNSNNAATPELPASHSDPIDPPARYKVILDKKTVAVSAATSDSKATL